MGLGKSVHSHLLSVPVAIMLSEVALISMSEVALIVEIVLLSATVVDRSE